MTRSAAGRPDVKPELCAVPYNPDHHRYRPGAVLHGLELTAYVVRHDAVTGERLPGRRRGWAGYLAMFRCVICGDTFAARVADVERDIVACTNQACNQILIDRLKAKEGARNGY